MSELNFIALPGRISFSDGAQNQPGEKNRGEASFFAILQCMFDLDEAGATCGTSSPKTASEESDEGADIRESAALMPAEGSAAGTNDGRADLAFRVEGLTSLFAPYPFVGESTILSEKPRGGVPIEGTLESTALLFEGAPTNPDGAKGIFLASEPYKNSGKHRPVEAGKSENIPVIDDGGALKGEIEAIADSLGALGIMQGEALPASEAVLKEELSQRNPSQGRKDLVPGEEGLDLIYHREPFEKKPGEAEADLTSEAFREAFKTHKGPSVEDFAAKIGDGHGDPLRANRSFSEALAHLADRSRFVGETPNLSRNGASFPFLVALEGEGIEAAGDGLSHAIRFIHRGNIDKAYVITEPPEWGRIQIDLGLSRDGLEALIKVENEGLAASLRGQMEGLKTALESSGINLAHIAVEAKGKDAGNGSGDSPEDRRRKRGTDPPVGKEKTESALFQLDLERGLLCWIA